MRGSLTRACLFAAALSVGAAAACNPTGGVPIELTLAFEGLGPATFTTSSGWEVELTEAKALIGPLYAYAPEDEMAWMSALAPSRALAHGGHSPLEGRLVRAELLDVQVLDALGANATDVVTLGGFAGSIDALTVVLGPPSDEVSDGPTHGQHVWVAGTARREGVEVRFEGGLTLDDVRLRRVDGVVVETGAPLTAGARLVVGADASAWLAEADFSEVGDGVFVEGSQPHRALYLGARSAASWAGRVEGGER